MGDFSKIVRKRTPPGVLIFDRDDRLLFVNREAVEMVPSLAEPAGELPAATPRFPEEIGSVCRILKGSAEDGTEPVWPVIATPAGIDCTLKASFLGVPGKEVSPSHIMVLMERIVERREGEFAGTQREYNLSNREFEVLKLLCRGLSNREIAERFYISEYTVKDHVKRIMRKTGLGSRGKIIACFR